MSIGRVLQFNHNNLPAAEKDNWGTYLGAVALMNVGPGPDHTGHCMRETLTQGTNTCPASVTNLLHPCNGHSCLDINHGTAGDALTHSTVTDGPASFIDLHRAKGHPSLLENSGVSSCSIQCGQVYQCEPGGTAPATGSFTITRNFVGGTRTKADGSSMHFTSGSVTKT